MSQLVIDNISYGLTFGSDVDDDGVFLELVDPRLSGHGVILVAFKSDVTGQVAISMRREKLPVSVVLRFLDAARAEWPSAVV